ncbi:MAG: hypothetical protein ACRDP8_20510 [Actinopolymorphaceae bacterium]
MRGGKASRVLLGLVAVGTVVVVGAKIASDKLFEQPLIDGCFAHVAGKTTRLSVEEAENAALISALSVRRGMPARAASIALVTAFQESGMRNIDYGDRDSVGLFQQRPSQGWGTAEQILDPYYATTRFYAALENVDGYDVMAIADAAQLVQRSADGAAYAQHEPGARTLASSLTGETPAAFFCELRDVPATASPQALRDELAKAFGSGTDDARADDVASRSLTRDDPAESGDDSADAEGAGPERTEAGAAVGADDEAVVDIPLGEASPAYGWSVAQWAVAYSQRFGIVSVSYGARTWSAEQSSEGWQQADPRAPAGRVRIVLAASN